MEEYEKMKVGDEFTWSSNSEVVFGLAFSWLVDGLFLSGTTPSYSLVCSTWKRVGYPNIGDEPDLFRYQHQDPLRVKEEEGAEPVRFSPPRSPSMVVHRRLPTAVTTPPLPPHLTSEETPLFLADPVIPKGLPPPLQQQQQLQQPPQQQKSLMDQLQGVVNSFSTGIPDFNAVLAVPGGLGNGVRSLFPPPPPPQHLQMLPLQLSTFGEEPISPLAEDEDDSEQFKLLQEYVYEREGNTEEDELEEEEEDLPGASKLTPEDSPALTPPSPFRDSVASGSSVPSSPVSESVLCTPPNVTYASVILRDYKQSSSTL
nr:metabotropic glutamate receptor 1-like [Loxodonta africana]